MRIRVVFLQDVLPRYLAGEVREVAGGYARNYLIPKGLAAPATRDHLQRISTIKNLAEERRLRETKDLEALAGKVQGLTITVKMRAGEQGKLFGSVTNASVAAELGKLLERAIDRRIVDLPEPIKELGTFSVPVRLSRDQAPVVTVVVEAASKPTELTPTPATPLAEAKATATAEAPTQEAGAPGAETQQEAPSQQEEDPNVRGEAPTT